MLLNLPALLEYPLARATVVETGVISSAAWPSGFTSVAVGRINCHYSVMADGTLLPRFNFQARS